MIQEIKLITSYLLVEKFQNLLHLSTNTVQFTMVKKNRISATLIPRVLSWTKQGISLLKKHKGTYELQLQQTNFERALQPLFCQIVDQIGEITGGPMMLCSNAPFSSRNYPFLYGSPDFAVVRSDGKPLLVIELKEITSIKEFKRHVGMTNEGKYFLRSSSEYYRQMQAYLNILMIPSGLVIVKKWLAMLVFKVHLVRYGAAEIEKLTNFYFSMLLPFVLLHRYPTKKHDGYRYFSDQELRELKNKVLQDTRLAFFQDFDLQSMGFGRAGHCDRFIKQRKGQIGLFPL